MPKLLTIQIPEPCGEHPDNMSPTAKGSYCHSCKKEVIDFTMMSDESIAAFFVKNSGNACGRFYPDQLNKSIPLPKKQTPWLKYFFAVSLPAFLFSLKGSAQTKNTPTAFHLTDHKFHAGKDVLIPVYPSVFTGKVIDQKGEPVEAASVHIKNSKRGTITDQNGMFEIALQPGDSVLSISSVGIVPKDIPALLNETGIIQVENIVSDLSEVTVVATGLGVCRTSQMLGGYSVTYATITKRNIFSPKKDTAQDIKIYPNPIKSGATLNIGWKNKIQTNQLIEIFSADGSLIQKEEISVIGKTSQSSFVLKSIRPGFYILMVIDTKSGKKVSKEFIVE